MPIINLGRVGFVQKGTYNSSTPYKVNDVVTDDGQVFACTVANTGEPLTDSIYWSPWVSAKGIISDNTPLETKAYSGYKTQQLHDYQSEALANLSAASGKIQNKTTPVFNSIPLVLTDMPFDISVNSTDLDIIEFDSTLNTLTFKVDASYNFFSTVEFESSTNQARTVDFALINTANGSVVTQETYTLEINSGDVELIPFNTLLTLGKNGMPSAPLTIKIKAIASNTGYKLNRFSSIIASSSTYDSSSTNASQVSVTPSGNIEATTVQGALQELDSEKAINTDVLHTTGDETKDGVLTFISIPKAPTATLGNNTTNIATTAFVKAAIDAIPAPTIPAATETVAGKVELATNAEVQTGTDTTRAVTPAGMKAGLNASGTAPIYACRAWVNFNGTGVVAIRASGNVSSITDNGVGDYTMNFSTAMPDANYSRVAMMAYANRSFATQLVASGYETTSSCRFNTVQEGSGVVDSAVVTMAIFR